MRVNRGVSFMWKYAFLVLALGLFFSPIHAETDAHRNYIGPYAGLGMTYSNVYAYSDTCFGCYGEADYGSGSTGFAATAGYRFMPYLGVELAYADQGTPKWSQSGAVLEEPSGFYDVSTDMELSSLQATVLGVLPFGNKWEVYLRAGAAFWEGKGNQSLVGNSVVTREVERDGNSFVLGGGGGVTLADHWHVNLDYVYYSISDDLMPTDIANDAYTDVLTVQILYRFSGAR